MVNRMWNAILKPLITGKHSEKRKKNNLLKTQTILKPEYSRIRLTTLPVT